MEEDYLSAVYDELGSVGRDAFHTCVSSLHSIEARAFLHIAVHGFDQHTRSLGLISVPY